MTKKEREGNIVIANFLCLQYNNDWLNPFDRNNILPWFDLEFHSSYHWLLYAVEKIEKKNYGFKMCRKVVEIYCDDSKNIILKIKEKNRIESLFKAIVEFIKIKNVDSWKKI